MTTSFPSEKQIVPTANVLESRLRIFQPTQRPKFVKNQKIETPWGTTTITGRLGQRHADLIEFIRFCAEKSMDRAGKLWLLVDPHKLRGKMGKRKHYSHEQIKSLIKDLTEASVQTDTDESWTSGHLIDNFIESTVERVNPGALLPIKKMEKDGKDDVIVIIDPPGAGAKRKLWAIEVGIPGRKFLLEGIKLYYDPGPIARLKSGMSQALARHVLGHKTAPNGGWKLDSLITLVAGTLTGMKLRDARRAIKDDSSALLEIGIEVKDGRINLLNEDGFAGEEEVKDIIFLGLGIVVTASLYAFLRL